jgi:hypothetical protein
MLLESGGWLVIRSRTPRSLLVTAIGVAASLVFTYAGPSVPVVRAAANCSGQTFEFDGTDPPGQHNYGVKATIEKRTPSLCIGGAAWSDSSLWVMTTGGCDEEYIQSGYGRHSGEADVYPFAQYDIGVGNNFVHKQLANPVPAGSKVYYVKYNFSTGVFSAYYDGQFLLGVNVDTNWCTGRESQYEAEVHDGGDDVPGTAANKASVDNMLVVTSHSGVWVAPQGLTASSTSARYDVDWAANQTHMRVWTK